MLPLPGFLLPGCCLRLAPSPEFSLVACKIEALISMTLVTCAMQQSLQVRGSQHRPAAWPHPLVDSGPSTAMHMLEHASACIGLCSAPSMQQPTGGQWVTYPCTSKCFLHLHKCSHPGCCTSMAMRLSLCSNKRCSAPSHVSSPALPNQNAPSTMLPSKLELCNNPAMHSRSGKDLHLGLRIKPALPCCSPEFA